MELTGAPRLLLSQHRFKKEKHRGDEQLTAKSRRCSIGAEGQGAGLAACGSSLPTSARFEPCLRPTRAWLSGRGWKDDARGESRGLKGSRLAQKGKTNPADFEMDSAGEGNLRSYGLEKKNRVPTGGPEVSVAEGRERECCARGPGRWAENELGHKKERGKGNGPGGKLGFGWPSRGGFPFFFSFIFSFPKTFFQSLF